MSAAHGCCATARKTGSNERGDIGGNNGYVDDECGPATTHEQHEHCEPAAQHLARHAAARADVAKRLEVTHTEARLTVQAWHHEQLMRAGQRLAFAKATMHRRLGGDGPAYALLAPDLALQVVTPPSWPRLASLTGTWLVRGVFRHGEPYKYCMSLRENCDGSVGGGGSFGDRPYHPTFTIRSGTVRAMQDDGRVRQPQPQPQPQPVDDGGAAAALVVPVRPPEDSPARAQGQCRCAEAEARALRAPSVLAH
eukprot:COSAG01_NODE_3699_length_5782_cov_4.602147_1_plen_252_part_00